MAIRRIALEGEIHDLPLALIDVDQAQPRRHFSRSDLDALASSISEVGLLQPVVVSAKRGRYRLVAGERRLRACAILDYKTIQALVLDPSVPLGLARGAENVARVALSPAEMLGLICGLLEDHPPVAIASALGVSRRLVGHYLQVSRSPDATAALRAGMPLRRVIAEHLREAPPRDRSLVEVETFLPPPPRIRAGRDARGALRRPYYEDPSVQLYHADAADIGIETKSVTCVVTSPPYNVGIAYDSYDDSRPWDDYWEDVKRWAAEMARVLIDGGRAWVCLAPVVAAEPRPARPHSGRSTTKRVALAANWSLALEAAGLLAHDQIAWSATKGLGSAWGSWQSPAAPALRGDHEVLLVHSKGAWARKTPEAFRSWQDRLGDWPQLASSVWDIPAEAGTEGFPAAFPLELARRAIRLSTWPGELVVDPFAGSGTVLVAARSLGRHALGTEISKSTCAIAARRLREDT